jgi:hypothetical protein
MNCSARIDQIDDVTSLLPPTVDSASSSPYLLAPLGEFAATMLRVGLRPLNRHFAAGLFLRLLFLPVPRCHNFIVRSACVIQGHFVCSFKDSLFRKAICRRVSYPGYDRNCLRSRSNTWCSSSQRVSRFRWRLRLYLSSDAPNINASPITMPHIAYVISSFSLSPRFTPATDYAVEK